MPTSLIIGSRGSKLALVQTGIVASMLEAAGESVEIRTIATSGDRTEKPLAEEGGKGLFVKEIEDALLAREIDIAVHSMKDVPGMIPEGLSIVAIPKREDPRDVFLSNRYAKFDDLPKGAKVGTSSPRRQAQLKDLRPDLELLPLRGNVDTRVRKLREGQYDAIILAAAGLIRLGMQGEIKEYIPAEMMIPSVGQGALAIEVREEEGDLSARLKKICNHEGSSIAVAAERAFLKTIGGDCHTALAAHAVLNGERIKLAGYLDGVIDRIEGPISEAEELGRRLAMRLYSSSER